VVVEAGPGATLRQPGDRVAIPWLGSACGHCTYCVAGWETLCESQVNGGYAVDGSYAEYALADDRYVAFPTRCRPWTRPLEDVNACFDEVLAGQVPARLVFTF
jgi:propanol-preferring alcohol dehydrogenase